MINLFHFPSVLLFVFPVPNILQAQFFYSWQSHECTHHPNKRATLTPFPFSTAAFVSHLFLILHTRTHMHAKTEVSEYSRQDCCTPAFSDPASTLNHVGMLCDSFKVACMMFSWETCNYILPVSSGVFWQQLLARSMSRCWSLLVLTQGHIIKAVAATRKKWSSPSRHKQALAITAPPCFAKYTWDTLSTTQEEKSISRRETPTQIENDEPVKAADESLKTTVNSTMKSLQNRRHILVRPRPGIARLCAIPWLQGT